jgi:hypothetical protein
MPPSKLIPPEPNDLDLLDSLTLPIQAESIELREASGGAALTEERRLELLAAVRKGEVVELTMKARPFRQSSTPRPLPKARRAEANARYVYLPPAELARFAESFAGRPFLRDHNRNDLLARGGKIETSELGTSRNWQTIEQSIRLVKPWAVESALDGTIEAFSIGWDPAGGNFRERIASIICTVCEAPMMSSDCPHMPGDEAKVDGRDGTYIVEAEFRGAAAAEVSAVTFPAVKGTTVDSIRAALSEARKTLPRKARRMNPEILKRLGLSADATPDQIERALAARLDDSSGEEIRARLAATEEQLRGAQGQLATVRATEAEAAAKRATAKIAELSKSARERGLWTPGSASEAYFQKVAARDLAEAEEYIETLTPVVPLRVERQSKLSIAGGLTAPSKAFEEIAGVLSAEYGADELQVATAEVTFRKMRISPAMFAEHGPHVLRDPDDPWLDDGAGSLDYRKGA